MRIILLIPLVWCFSLQAQPLLLNLANGNTGQVLTKSSNTHCDYTWVTINSTTVGLGNVNNTSDANKPVSTAQANAIALKLSIPVAGQGTGGTVTQATSKSTGVTLNKQYGRITMNGAALAAAAEVAFTLTNSFIAATDIVIVNIQSVGTAGSYFVTVGAVAAGSCSITVGNASAGSLSQAIVLNYAVIKSVID